MTNYKSNDGMLHSISWSKSITISEYNKATITYEAIKPVYKTTTEKKQDTVVDADGNTIVLREYEVDVPVLEEGKPIIIDNVRETVTYNQYNWYVIIPDDATILTEEEYQKEIEKLSFKTENK